MAFVAAGGASAARLRGEAVRTRRRTTERAGARRVQMGLPGEAGGQGVVVGGAATAEAPVAAQKAGTDMEAWRRLWRSAGEEVDYIVPAEEIEGAVPMDVEGTLFVNGPAKLERNGEKLKHPWDGDGMISAVGLKNGEVWFRNRFVRTRYFLVEERVGRFQFRGDFRQMKPGGWTSNAFIVKTKNPANVNAVFWAERLLALCDSKPPHLIDTQTLATLGQSRLGGALDEAGIGGAGGFTAHPKIDPINKRLVGFSANITDRALNFMEFDDEFKKVSSRSVKLRYLPFVHDFALTKNYYIVVDSPVDISPLKFLLGLRAPAQCLTYDASRPARVILVPRHDASAEPIVVEHSAFFCFHFANAYEEDETGDIVVDLVHNDTLSFDTKDPNAAVYDVNFDEVPSASLKRMRVSLGNGGAKSTLAFRTLGDGASCEMPMINARLLTSRHSIVYTGVRVSAGAETSGPLNAVRKMNVETGESQVYTGEPHEFFNEPVFVPRVGAKGEDDGYIFTYCMDGKNEKVSLLILDAKNLSGRPVCRIPLRTHFPYTLHGNWTAQTWERDESRSKTSSHEIFYGKGWNDFNSDFSSFGTNAF